MRSSKEQTFLRNCEIEAHSSTKNAQELGDQQHCDEAKAKFSVLYGRGSFKEVEQE